MIIYGRNFSMFFLIDMFDLRISKPPIDFRNLYYFSSYKLTEIATGSHRLRTSSESREGKKMYSNN